MAEELEELWKKLTFTEEEEEGINLSGESTKIAREIGKNCLVMKILTQRSINLEALRKTMRMLWRPNRAVQISEIDEELFLVEFGDTKDKKKVLEMCPWSFEKNLVLLQEFEGELVPKEINLKWSPFWVQIHNLPLKSMTKETGWEIGSKVGRVIDVDVPEKGVCWGKYLRVRVQFDTTKKLIRAKKVKIEDDEPRLVFFRYERLPNFCYRCGIIGHGDKECPERSTSDNGMMEVNQYGAWLRGEPGRKSNMDNGKSGTWFQTEFPLSGKGGGQRDNEVTDPHAPHVTKSPFSQAAEASVQIGDLTPMCTTAVPSSYANKNVSAQKPDTASSERNSLELDQRDGKSQTGNLKSLDVTKPKQKVMTKLENNGTKEQSQTNGLEDEGPIAMIYETEMGWVPETKGPNSVYWRRIKREKVNNSPKPKQKSCGKKRSVPNPL
ncbi:uncharacterized protein LOC115990603 [Quercus lobata]|uniref:uncharacterized protein LOC115990603 n=1 Tax=Quercus lobata TaxID=97700 RepID=UPI0012445E6E|nr:uncharacterized protein LOC115990603 [Quercus lobata]